MHSSDSAPTPQLHSPDYLIRVAAPVLAGIVFEHLFTMQDDLVLQDSVAAGLPARRAGTTEWKGHLGRAVVSLGWDWVQADDGALWAFQAVPPRTNVRLIDSKGYDCPPDVELEQLWLRIAAIPWTGPAEIELACGNPATSMHGVPSQVSFSRH